MVKIVKRKIRKRTIGWKISKRWYSGRPVIYGSVYKIGEFPSFDKRCSPLIYKKSKIFLKSDFKESKLIIHASRPIY